MLEPGTYEIFTEEAMLSLGKSMVGVVQAGDVVLLEGDLGAGKTTFVRGYLRGCGWEEPVRSPTFNLVQFFDTNPPVLHADLYRVKSHEGIGLEDYMDDHVCFIEWPDRAVRLVRAEDAWRIRIDFKKLGRLVQITAPKS